MSLRLKTILGHLQPTQLEYDSPDYVYTLNRNGALSQQEQMFYEKNGYLVIKNCVPSYKLDVYRQRFQDICAGKNRIPSMVVMKDISLAKGASLNSNENERNITKIQDFQDDEVLFEYCCLPEVLQYVEAITGPNIMTAHTMIINKPPDTGTKSSRHPFHQDYLFAPYNITNRLVCAWTAMEKVTVQNGCLAVVPGTHKGKLLEHSYPKWEGGVNKMYHGIEYDPSQPRVHLEMDKGDTVFFHPLLFHGSGRNRTSGFRKAISCHFVASEATYLKNAEGTVRSKLYSEWEQVLQNRYGKYVPFWVWV